MRRTIPLPLLLLLFIGCKATEIPPLPDPAYTVVLTSGFSPDKLYAEGLAAFLRAGWTSLTPTEAGLTATILPEGTEDVPLAVRVEAEGEDASVLTATVGVDGPGGRDVLIRTARILASISGTISYQ